MFISQRWAEVENQVDMAAQVLQAPWAKTEPMQRAIRMQRTGPKAATEGQEGEVLTVEAAAPAVGFSSMWMKTKQNCCMQSLGMSRVEKVESRDNMVSLERVEEVGQAGRPPSGMSSIRVSVDKY